MSGDFDHREFMYDMVNGKFKLYNSFSEELKQSLDSTAQKFRDYYINTVDTFVVNREFNFIPKMMLSENSKYYHKLIELGYRRTEVGLYFPSGDPTPIISFK
jgi:hypothetical protein